MMRQGANSAVRFSSYSSLKSFVQKPGQSVSGPTTFAIGAAAGVITVYCTMPFEYARVPSNPGGGGLNFFFLPCCSFSVIKTRMQSLDARQNYRNSAHCAYRIVTEEGVLR
jgi:solute carrier family 25 (mitochondrial citrate transporter), member 1